jgi:asparaginyl-tRNA synthetase
MASTSRHLAEFWMIEPEIAFADLADNAALAEALLKYTFAALLNERQEDLAFFDQRIEKGLVAKLEGIVGSEFVHMDYCEAIQVLERANEKFEFPVNWGIDLQSEHERYLTEKHAKKPVIVMNYPKAITMIWRRHMLIFIKCDPPESWRFGAISRSSAKQRWDHLVRIPMLTGSARIFPASSNVLSRL